MNNTHFYILNIRSGRELVAHELFEKEGYQVYTPFQIKYQRKTSPKARRERSSPEAYADPLYKGFLFISRDNPDFMHRTAFLIQKREYLYSMLVYPSGEPIILRDRDMTTWIANIEGLKNKNIKSRGYDSKKDRRKNQQRLYGQKAIEMPVFEVGDVVRFEQGSFAGIDMKVKEIGDETVDLMGMIFGSERDIADASVYELKKVG